MSAIKTYSNATAFRTALETRLKNMAREEGVDLQRFRRQVAFDRLLCRLFYESDPPWALKGGYGMELRMQVARTTRDIDLTFKNLDLLLGRNEQKSQVILDLLQKAVSVDLGDYFVFLIGEPMMNLDAAPYGGSRYPVEARMDGRAFVKFHIDVGVGDSAIEPLDNVKGRDWLSFIGISSGSFPVISKAQQFAEKLHAYTLPRQQGMNSRVRDLVDMVLLISKAELNINKVTEAVKKTFSQRNTHSFPVEIPEPPDDWKTPFEAMARDCGITMDISEAFIFLKSFYENL
ncbi:nucleotidyl transferase AbiEii/AbiGii toxin family protein [Verrucomicrobiota bacterium]